MGKTLRNVAVKNVMFYIGNAAEIEANIFIL